MRGSGEGRLGEVASPAFLAGRFDDRPFGAFGSHAHPRTSPLRPPPPRCFQDPPVSVTFKSIPVVCRFARTAVHRAFPIPTIVQLSAWQTTFYKDTHAHWGELWDALRVEEDLSISSAPETVQIWWEIGELAILKRPKFSIPPPAVGIARTPTDSNNSTRSTSDVVVVPGLAVANGHTPQTVWSPPPLQYVQYVQHPQHVQLQSPPRQRPKQQTDNEPTLPLSQLLIGEGLARCQSDRM